ncbi:hypothetical protein AB0H00_30700 [Nocardia sp. NPDC023852]|uniref:hypothetical protein n=1 Tax=Nocardia sp. NPDC023852 TaxID=3154697 RepID=UPI0033C7CAF8
MGGRSNAAQKLRPTLQCRLGHADANLTPSLAVGAAAAAEAARISIGPMGLHRTTAAFDELAATLLTGTRPEADTARP